LRQLFGARARAGSVRQQRELVTAVTRNQRLTAQARAQAVGDLDQQQIATGVAEAVVDELESVQIKKQDGIVRILAPPRIRDDGRQFLFEIVKIYATQED